MTSDLENMNPDGPVDAPPADWQACPPGLLPAARVAFVEAIHHHFLTTLTQGLAVYLDTDVAPAASSASQMPVAGFIGASDSDACLLTLELAPVRGQAWVGLSSEFVFRVLDIMLGAAPGPKTDRPPVTEIEFHVLQEFFDFFVQSLDVAWQKAGIQFRIAATGAARDTVLPGGDEGAALVFTCNLQLGDAPVSFRVALPVLAVRLAAERLEQAAAGEAAPETPARAALLDALGGANVQVEAVMGGSTLRMSDLAAMQPGQVLMLSRPAGTLFDCLVNGKLKYRGEWITQGDHQALQIESRVSPTAVRV